LDLRLWSIKSITKVLLRLELRHDQFDPAL
jgi:hypothetical protein